MLTLLLFGACSPDRAAPDYLYFDASFDPVVSPARMLVGAKVFEGGPSALATSSVYAADPLGVRYTEGAISQAVAGPDGFVLQTSGNRLEVYTDRLSPWASIRLPGVASAVVPVVAADGRSFVGDAAGNVSAFDLNGDPLWTVQVGGEFYGRGALDEEERLLLLRRGPGAGEDGLVALDIGSGDLLWAADLPSPWSPPVPFDGRVYIVQYLGDPGQFVDRDPALFRLQARDGGSGALLWELDPGNAILAPVVTGSGDLITSIYTLDVSYAAVVRLSGSDGREQWRVDEETFYGRPTLLNNGDLLVGCGGDLCQLSANNGAEQRRFVLDGYSVAYAPLALDGLIIANSLDVYVGWYVGGGLRTATTGWARTGGGNHGAGRMP